MGVTMHQLLKTLVDQGGTDLHVTWAFTLKEPLVGDQEIFGLARDKTGREGQFQRLGPNRFHACFADQLREARRQLGEAGAG